MQMNRKDTPGTKFVFDFPPWSQNESWPWGLVFLGAVSGDRCLGTKSELPRVLTLSSVVKSLGIRLALWISVSYHERGELDRGKESASNIITFLTSPPFILPLACVCVNSDSRDTSLPSPTPQVSREA